MPENELHGTVGTTDGFEICWRAWVPSGTPRGVLFFVHGLFEHSERYGVLGDHFRNLRFACYAVDLRGHGYSSGRRVHVNHFDDYSRDVDAGLRLARERHPGLPIFLVGHSMGGVVALRYALDHGHELHGLILSSPALSAHPDSQPPAWLAALGKLLSKLAPRTLVDAGLDSSFISRDEKVVAAYRADTRIGTKVSARWFTAMSAAQTACRERVGDLQVPVLLVQAGSDRLAASAASARWAEKAARESNLPAASVVVRSWPDCYHELFNEPEKVEVFTVLETWLDEHLAPG